MKWIKFNGKNAFQVYGFVKDHTSKYEWWKIKFGRYALGKNVLLYQDGVNTAGREIYIGKGDYIVFNDKEDYVFRIYKYNGNILLHMFKWIFKAARKKDINNNLNVIKDVIKDDQQ